MSRICDFTAKGVVVGNNVSHSNRKTKRRFLPNLQTLRLYSEAMGAFYRFTICTKALRTINRYGGLDGFLLKTKARNLSIKARRLKKVIHTRCATTQAVAA